MKFNLTLLVLLLTIQCSVAQLVTEDQYRDAADTAFYSYKDYYNASVFYQEALKFGPTDSMALITNAALGAYHSWNLMRADSLYEWIEGRMDENEDMFVSIFNHGRVLLRKGKYQLAKDKFKEFIEKASLNNVQASLRIDAGYLSAACAWAMKSRKHFPCELEAISVLNECMQHQLAPVMYKGNLIYTSYAYPEECIDDFFHQIGHLKALDTFNNITNWNESILRTSNDLSKGFLTFNKDHTRVYYAKCKALNTIDSKCQIVSRTINESGEIGLEERVELGAAAGLDLQRFTYTHPNVAWDTLDSSQEHLYFVSDLEGGKGGLDIWIVPLDDDGAVQKEYRENVIDVNSGADEVSPFFHSQQSRLYFSSNNYEDCKSYGGFDIYKSSRSRVNGSFEYDMPNVLRQPINTSKHDIFYVLSPDSTKSWFSSNRTDPYFSCTYTEACCYNIFQTDCQSFYNPEVREYCTEELLSPECDTGVIRNIDPSLQMEMLPFDPEEDKPVLDECGVFKVLRGQKYWLRVSKPGYITDSLEVEVGKSQCGEFSCSLFLKPEKVELLVMIKDRCASAMSYMNINEVQISCVQEGVSVDLEFASENSGVFKLKPFAPFSLEINQDGYEPYSTTGRIFRRRGQCDSIAMIELSPIKTILDESISLYFDNDVPGPHTSTVDTAQRSYIETWVDGNNNCYLRGCRERHTGYGTKERELYYLQNVNERLHPDISSFFTEARSQHSRYEEWKKNLSELFLSNPVDTVTIIVEGHASPLSNPGYNLQLSKRRINSIVRDIAQSYPILRAALNDGRLVIPSTPKGDKEGREKGVSADASQKELSIFHPEAAKLRRISFKVDKVQCP